MIIPSHLFELVIATRDSERWIGEFLDAYRAIGVDPLYLVDARSSDNTASILSAMQARSIRVTPRHDRVEAILATLPDLTSKIWVVRMDDDEFPSIAMIEWLCRTLEFIDVPAVACSRRDSLWQGGRLLYSRLKDFYFHAPAPTYLNPQWRVFQPREVVYTDAIHTPGFVLDKFLLAPEDAFFIHLDWVVRSLTERQEKLARYELQRVGAGEHFKQFYTPELHDQRDLQLTPFATAEFRRLIHALVHRADT